MKNSHSLVFSIITLLFSCTGQQKNLQNPNRGDMEIEIKVSAGNDSIIRTINGDTIGKIDSKGNIFDLGGNKIGKRKPTDAELIEQAGY